MTASTVDGTAIQLADPELDIFIKTQQDHIVDAGPDEDDRHPFVRSRLGNSCCRFTDFAGFTEKDTLSPSLPRIKRVCLGKQSAIRQAHPS